MRATINKALVKVDLKQKGQHGLIIQMKEFNPDGKEANNVLCEVIDCNSEDYPYIKSGDTILVHHNFFAKESGFLISKDFDKMEAVYVIPVKRSEFPSNIYAKIVDGEAEPICDNILVERIEIEVNTFLIVPDSAKKYYQDRVRVVKSNPEVHGVKKGDVIMINKYADAELVYNWGNKEHRVFKLWREDIIGIFKEETI